MRMSCNGCRVLRKGCGAECSIRPCLQWMGSPQAQSNATVFLAKFYGRAGLLNLLNSGPPHLRPAIFRSLLHEACGRVVNPTYGSVGLLWSGKWQLCQAAVEAVLSGAPVAQLPPCDAAADAPATCDIRHVASKAPRRSGAEAALRKVRKAPRHRFKRPPAAAAAAAVIADLNCLPAADESSLADTVEFESADGGGRASTAGGGGEAVVDAASHVSDVQDRREGGGGEAEENHECSGLELTLGIGL